MATVTAAKKRVPPRRLGPWTLVIFHDQEDAVIERLVGAPRYWSMRDIFTPNVETWFTYAMKKEAELTQALVVLSGYEAEVRRGNSPFSVPVIRARQ